MTEDTSQLWLKLFTDFYLQTADLSDGAHRVHVDGLQWTRERLSDGRILKADLRRFGNAANPQAAVDELVACGFWVDEGEAWVIKHHQDRQPTASHFRERWAADAKRKRDERARKRASGSAPGIDQQSASDSASDSDSVSAARTPLGRPT